MSSREWGECDCEQRNHYSKNNWRTISPTTVNNAVMLTTEENAPSLLVTLISQSLHFSPLHVGAQDDALRRFRNHHRLLVAHSRSPRTRHRHVQKAILTRHTRLHELVVRVAVRNRLVVAVVRTALIRVTGTSLEAHGENGTVQRLEWRGTG